MDNVEEKKDTRKFLIEAKTAEYSAATDICVVEGIVNACQRYQELSRDHKIVNMQILQDSPELEQFLGTVIFTKILSAEDAQKAKSLIEEDLARIGIHEIISMDLEPLNK